MLAERLNKAWTARHGGIDPVMRFTDEGLVLGAGTVLAKCGAAARDISIDPSEPRLRALLTAAHLQSPTHESLAHLRKAAQRWSEGEDALAAMHLALSGVDRLQQPEADARRIFLAEGLLNAGFVADDITRAVKEGDTALIRLQKYDPDQPRVPAGSGRSSGQWTSGDDGSPDTTKPLVYPPRPEVNPDSITEVAVRSQGYASIYACNNAYADCIRAADEAEVADHDAANDNLPLEDYKNCRLAMLVCNTLSWVIEDLPLPLSGGVIYPHRGVVLIKKGRLDVYYPPGPGGTPPVINRGLESSLGCSLLRKVVKMDAFPSPSWTSSPDETPSKDPAGFSPCLRVIDTLASRMGGTVAAQSLTTSKQWGKIVRARIADNSAASTGSLPVMCWQNPDASVQILVGYDGYESMR
jgi:hypothetical protein